MSDQPSTPSHEMFENARQGDAEAADRVIEEHQSFVRNEVEQRLPQKLRRQHGVSDVAQDVLVEARRNIHKFQGGRRGVFRAWLRTISRNVINTLLRRRRIDDGPLPAGSSGGDYLPGCEPSPSVHADRNEGTKWLRQALAELRPEDQRLITERFLAPGSPDGVEPTYEDLAIQFGKSADALKKRQSVVLGMLKQGIDCLKRMEQINMPAHYKRLFCLKHLRGCTLDEIAGELGVPKKEVNRMLIQLQQRLGKPGDKAGESSDG